MKLAYLLVKHVLEDLILNVRNAFLELLCMDNNVSYNVLKELTRLL